MSAPHAPALDDTLRALEDALDWRELQRARELEQELPADLSGDALVAVTLMRARVAQLLDERQRTRQLALEALRLAQRRDHPLGVAGALAILVFQEETRDTFVGRLDEAWERAAGDEGTRVRVAMVQVRELLQSSLPDALARCEEALEQARSAGMQGSASQLLRVASAIHMFERRLEASLEAARRSVALAEVRPGARLAASWLQVAAVQWERGEREEARAAVDAAAALVHDDWVLQARVASLMRQVGWFEASVEQFRELYEVDPAHRPTAGLGLAISLVCLERLDEAREVAAGLSQPMVGQIEAATRLVREALRAEGAFGADPAERAAARLPPDDDVVRVASAGARVQADPCSTTAVRLRALAVRTAEAMERPELAADDAEALRDLPLEVDVPLGPFDVGQLLGRGGHARVFAGRHHRSGVPVAIKVLTEATRPDELEREARLVARLRHPHVVGVLGFGQVDELAARMRPRTWKAGAAWLAMELVRDGTLVGWAGRLMWDEIHRILEALLSALAHAHGSGVLHLDLKPANVLLARTAEGWVPRLADFGVASMLQGRRARRVSGTPTAMAPEQWTGRPEALGPWTDLYGLGCLAWTLVTGEPPFTGDSMPVLRELHRNAPRPPLPRELGVPEELATWLHGLLAIDPADRPASAADALGALRALPKPEVPNAAPLGRRASTDVDSTFTLTATWTPAAAPTPAPHRPQTKRATKLPAAWPSAGRRLPLVEPELVADHLALGDLGPLSELVGPVWQALREVEAAGTGRILAWTGAQGRTLWSNIGQWVRESGGAAGFARGDDAAELLGNSVRRLLLHALTPASPRLLKSGALSVDPSTRRLLTALLKGELRPGAAEAVLRLLTTRLAGRPCLMVADVHGAALQVLRDHLDTLMAGPVLLLVRAPFPEAERTLEIPPLDRSALGAALQDRLALDDVLVDGLAVRADGDLDRALDLLEAQIRRGALEPSGHGWTLAPGFTLPSREVERERDDVDALVEAGRYAEVADELAARADTAARRGDRFELVAVVDRWLELGATLADLPLGPRYALYRGIALLMADELSAGEPYLLDAAGHRETAPVARNWLASLARHRHDLDAMEAHLLAGLRAEPEPGVRGHLLSRLAGVVLDRGRPDEAERRYREAIAQSDAVGALSPRLGLLVLHFPRLRDDGWLGELVAVQEEAEALEAHHIAYQTRAYGVLARVLWGELDRAEELAGSLMAEEQALIAVLAAVERADDEEVGRLLTGPRSEYLGQQAWRPLLQLWLEADAPESRWREVVRRWRPWCALGTVARWLLERVLRRLAVPERRDEVRALAGGVLPSAPRRRP